MIASDAAVEIGFALLVLWATTGLTIVHVGVLAWRGARRGLARRRARARGMGKSANAPLPDLSLTFIVPVYNDELTVGPTLESILRQTVRPTRILVVDDGSTDGTPAVLARYAGKGVDVMTLPRNVGKTRALDAALPTIRTDLVAITDSDSIVDAHYVEEVLQSFRDPDLSAVGGAVQSIPHSPVTAARQLEYMLTVNIDRDAEDTMGALVVLPGVSTTYRTRVLVEMGFEFDTIAEDFDLTFRMQRAGRKIAMNLRAKVYTSDPPTLKLYYRQLTRWYTDFWLVLRKHRAVLGKRVFGTVEVPLLVLNATVSSLLFLALPIYFLFAEPTRLLGFFAATIAFDLALVVIAWRIYRRNDLWGALLTRLPTRILGRIAYLLSMTRVLVGRPGMAWAKLDRRDTEPFLAGDTAKPRQVR